MASLTITSPFPAGYSTRASVGASSRAHSVVVMYSTRAVEANSLEKTPLSAESEKGSRGRRELVFAATALAAAALTRPAAAEDEPKRGTSEAKKKYAPVCVTNPTARICRN